jgi:hypothetical protein
VEKNFEKKTKGRQKENCILSKLIGPVAARKVENENTKWSVLIPARFLLPLFGSNSGKSSSRFNRKTASAAFSSY